MASELRRAFALNTNCAESQRRAPGTNMSRSKTQSQSIIKTSIARLIVLVTAIIGFVLPIKADGANAQLVIERSELARTLTQWRQTADYSEVNPSLLSSSARNMLSLARRWPTVTKNIVGNAMSERSATTRFPDELTYSRYSGFTRSQTSTAWCGRHVVVVFNDTGAEMTTMASGRGISQVGYAVSNRLAKFLKYMGPLPTPGDPNTFISGDAVAACSSGKNFYVTSSWLDGTNSVSGVVLSASTDGGHSFSAPSLVVGEASSTHIVDHPWIAIDPNEHNLMYVVYTDLDFSGTVCGTVGPAPVPRYAIEVVRSSDSGATWRSPVVVDQVCADSSHSFSFVNGAQLAVGPEGQVYVVWEAYGLNNSLNDGNFSISASGASGTSRALDFSKSLDGGTSFSTPVSISPVHCAGDCNDLQGLLHSNEYPSIAVGKGKYNQGTIFVAWNDGNDQVSDSLSAPGSYGYTDILIVRSKDGGATWSAPQRVNNNREGSGAPLTDQFEPAVATDERGQLAVCFYDRRHDPRNFRIDRYCAFRHRNHWINNRITKRSFLVIVGQDILVSPDYMGDYDTLASDFDNRRPGFIGAFATNRPGKPTIRSNMYRRSD